MKKRIGIAGLGSIAQKVYLPLLANHTGVEIAGIASRSASTLERLGDQYRIAQRFTQLKDLLALRPDAVFVHASTESHAEMVLACLRAQVHVYVDKPLSYDLRESFEMTETAAAHGVLLGVGFNRRFSPLYQEAKKWLTDGGGYSTCILQKHRTELQSFSARETIYDDLIHVLDLMHWLNDGKPELESFRCFRDENARLTHASGLAISGRTQMLFSMDRRAGADLEKVELFGNGKTARIVNMDQAFYAGPSGEYTRTFGSWDDLLYRRGFKGIVNHFLDSLDRPQDCLIRGELVLPTHEMAEKLVRSL